MLVWLKDYRDMVGAIPRSVMGYPAVSDTLIQRAESTTAKSNYRGWKAKTFLALFSAFQHPSAFFSIF